jgi:hypothetical protein
MEVSVLTQTTEHKGDKEHWSHHPVNSHQTQRSDCPQGRSVATAAINNSNSSKARYQWLALVIPATWEAEIRRIMVLGEPGQIVQETPHLQNNQCKMDWKCG